MSREASTEVELLEMCEYFEKVLRDGSRSSIASALELLCRDNFPYTLILKAKGIVLLRSPELASSPPKQVHLVGCNRQIWLYCLLSKAVEDFCS